MSRKGRRFLKAVGALYLMAVIAFIVSIPFGRARRTRPELIPTEITAPRSEDFAGRGVKGARAAYEEARKGFLAAGYRVRVPVGGLERGRLIGGEELASLVENEVRRASVWDPRLCRQLAARKLLCGEEIRDARGNAVVRVGEELTEKKLVEIAMVYDEKPVGERLESIWVRGAGSIIGFDLTLVFTGLNFLALVALLYAFLWDPVTRLLDDRAKGIRENIETARGEREEAETLKTDVERELSDIRRDARKMREVGRAEGEKERARLAEDGREEARRLVERAERAIEAEAEDTRKRLVSELAGLSAELAAEMLGREVTHADHERLTEEFLSSLRSAGTSAPRRGPGLRAGDSAVFETNDGRTDGGA